MNLKQVFRTAIIVEWVSTVLSYVALKLMASNLPQDIQVYLQGRVEQGITTADKIMFFPITILFIAYPVSSIGLFLFKPWAKKAYVIVSIAGIAFLPFLSPVISHPLSVAFGTIGTISSGFILALLFFTKVYELDKQSSSSL